MALIDDIKRFFPITSSTKDNERHQINQLMSSVIQYLEDLPESSNTSTVVVSDREDSGIEYLEEVHSDDTLVGKGTSSDVLSVSHSYNIESLADVTVVDQAIQIYLDGDKDVYTLVASENFTVGAVSSSSNLNTGMFYVYNNSSTPITMSTDSFMFSPLFNPDIPINTTAAYFVYAHGKHSFIIPAGGITGDARGTL